MGDGLINFPLPHTGEKVNVRESSLTEKKWTFDLGIKIKNLRRIGRKSQLLTEVDIQGHRIQGKDSSMTKHAWLSS